MCDWHPFGKGCDFKCDLKWVFPYKICCGEPSRKQNKALMSEKVPSPKKERKNEIVLMVQKSGEKTTWNVQKPCKSWDKLPTSTGFHAGCLNHQQYD